MTEKQFIEPDKECRVIKNIESGETATYYDTEDGLMFLKWLNDLSDENEQLKDNELKDRDIICQAGKFRLEEWGKHRYHQFYNGDEPLEDESIVIMLMELTRESEQLKQQLKSKERLIGAYEQFINDLKEDGVLDD